MENNAAARRPTAPIWFPLGLMLLVLVLRVLAQHGVVPNLNLSPLVAFAFVGTIVVPRPLPWWSWAAILLGVDLLSQGAAVWQPHNLPAILLTYACYIAIAWWGDRMRRSDPGVVRVLGGTVACSLLFFLVTNTFSWGADPAYAKTFLGWVQCMTVGTPGFPPTWMFFRNSLIADFCGATVLLLAYNGEAFVRGLRALPWIGGRHASSLATA
jgi:hypothetical protein